MDKVDSRKKSPRRLRGMEVRKCGPFSQLPAVDLDKTALLEVWSLESLTLELSEVALKKKKEGLGGERGGGMGRTRDG